MGDRRRLVREEGQVKALNVKLEGGGAQLYEKQGRSRKYAISGKGWAVMIYNVYGYTDGHTDPRQAQKANRILEAVLSDRERTGLAPAMLAGDFNADVRDLPALEAALQGAWGG